MTELPAPNLDVDEQVCALCAGTGKIKIRGPLPTSHGAATNVVFDLEALKDLKVICGT